MSSSKRYNRKKCSQQSRICEKVPLYIKQGIAKTKEVQNTLQSLCSDSSSSDEELPALRLGPLNTYKVDLTKRARQAVKCSTPKAIQSVADKNKKTRTSVSSKDSMTKKSQRRERYLALDSKSSESDCNKQKALSKTNAKGKKTVNNQRKERNESCSHKNLEHLRSCFNTRED